MNAASAMFRSPEFLATKALKDRGKSHDRLIGGIVTVQLLGVSSNPGRFRSP